MRNIERDLKVEILDVIDSVESITQNRFKYQMGGGKTYGIKGHRKCLKTALSNLLKSVNQYDEEWIEEVMSHFE